MLMLKAAPELGSKARFWFVLTIGLLLSGPFAQPLAAQQPSDVTGVVPDQSSAVTGQPLTRLQEKMEVRIRPSSCQPALPERITFD